MALTATVSGGCTTSVSGNCTPTGNVTFFADGVFVGVGILNNGTATINVTDLAVGTHTITATYDGDGNFAYSISSNPNPVMVKVLANMAQVTLSLLPAPPLMSSPYGGSLTFEASVTATTGSNVVPTGSVLFSSSLYGDLATVPVDSSGNAFLIINTIGVGKQTFTATYQPNCCDCLTAGSGTYGPFTITRVLPNFQLAVSALPSPIVYGDAITLEATISSFSIGTPTGSVDFYQGATYLGTAPIANGMAMLTVSNYLSNVNIPVGSNVPFRAVYSGDTNFLPTVSNQKLVPIVAAGVTVSLVSGSPNSSFYGETVNLTASVETIDTIPTGAGTQPTGSVQFCDGANSIGTATLDSSGIAHLNVSNLSVGPHTLKATYIGPSTSFQINVSSEMVTQTVVKADTVTTAAVTTAYTYGVGGTVSLSANVKAVSPGTIAPTGSVNFYYGSTLLGSANLSSGTATLSGISTTALAAGDNAITAFYQGNSNFNTSSGVATQTVNPQPTNISIPTATPASPSIYGQTVTFSTTVSATYAGGGPPTGTVSFRDGATEIGVATLIDGVATLSVDDLSVGAHSITAVYSGSGNFAASAISSALAYSVVCAPTVTTIVSNSPNPSLNGETVTFIALVTSPEGNQLPGLAGTVQFYDGATPIGSAVITNGTAALDYNTLSIGPHTITAKYLTDGNYCGSTSTAVTQVVNGADTSIVITTNTPNPSDVGQPVTFTATVTPAPGSTSVEGTISFYDGTTLIGTVPVSGNEGTIFTSNLALGSHNITAVYSGDTKNNPSTSPAVVHTVNKTTTTTTATASPTTSPYGSPVVLTANVVHSSGNPVTGGTVTFTDSSGNVLGTGEVVDGVATYTSTTIPAGTTVTANYGGNSSYSPSQGSVNPQVSCAATKTTLC